MTSFAEITSAVVQRCIACGGVIDHRLMPLVMRPESDEYLSYHIATCTRCGLSSSYPIPDQRELAEFYGRPKSPPALPDGLIKRLWHSVHDRAMIRIVSHYKPEGVLLDVGAGDGRFALAARKSGRWQVVGSELSSDLVQRLKNAGVDARCGEIDAIGLARESVDVIWVSHVLEHLPNPADFLAKALGLLKRGGVLVILVPSNRSLRARLGLSTWHYVNPPGHLWGFRPSTVKALVSRCGFVFLKSWEVHAICECVTVARKP